MCLRQISGRFTVLRDVGIPKGVRTANKAGTYPTPSRDWHLHHLYGRRLADIFSFREAYSFNAPVPSLSRGSTAPGRTTTSLDSAGNYEIFMSRGLRAFAWSLFDHATPCRGCHSGSLALLSSQSLLIEHNCTSTQQYFDTCWILKK
jgi:hypothetical protein